MSTVKWVESPEQESAMWETLCKRKGQVTEQLRQIAWIKRIAESSNALWKKIPNQALNQYGGLEFLIECDYDPNLLNYFITTEVHNNWPFSEKEEAYCTDCSHAYDEDTKLKSGDKQLRP